MHAISNNIQLEKWILTKKMVQKLATIQKSVKRYILGFTMKNCKTNI